MLVSSASPTGSRPGGALERIEVKGFETAQRDLTERTLTLPLSLRKGEATRHKPRRVQCATTVVPALKYSIPARASTESAIQLDVPI
jgi:hypothetical protein